MKKFGIYLILAAMLLQLVACGPATPGNETTPSGTEQSTNQNGETRVQHKLSEDLDFGGDTFSVAFLAGNANANKLYFLDEATSDVMDSAIYRRTSKTENFLNIDIQYTTEVEETDYSALYKAGDDLYQQLFLPGFPVEFMTAGYLLPLEDIPHLDLSAEWWNPEQMDALKLGQFTYFAINDFMITSPSLLMFNKNMIEDNNLENPYELVMDGKWTLDKYIEMSTAVRRDVDSDGEYTGEDDIVGGEFWGNYSLAFFTGSEQYISRKNDEGILELTLNTEKTLDIIDKLIHLRDTKGAYVDSSNGGFRRGNALFRGVWTDHISEAAHYEFDTGFLPLPKYNEQQENYICLNNSAPMGISGTTRNKELVGATLEYLAWDSKNEVFPTYYDVLLKTRYAQDMETRKMLDIIFDSMAYEVGGIYFGMQPGFCELWYIGDQVLLYGLSNFAAFHRAYKGFANQTIASFYEVLNQMEAAYIADNEALAQYQ